MIMPLTSVTKDAAKLTLTVVGDYPVPQKRLWDAFADPRQLERFWGPPAFPATFTRHDLKVGGRAEYFLTLPEGKKWSGSWKFTAVARCINKGAWRPSASPRYFFVSPP
jgi:uncharacterized protein YndB with AHSA1/START domain